jgi:hypothetical protein
VSSRKRPLITRVYPPTAYCFECIQYKVDALDDAIAQLRATRGGRARHAVARALNWFEYDGSSEGPRFAHEVNGHIPGALPVQLFQHVSGRLGRSLEPFEDRKRGAVEVRTAQTELCEVLARSTESPASYDNLDEPSQYMLALVGFIHRSSDVQLAHRAMWARQIRRGAFRSLLTEAKAKHVRQLPYMLTYESRNDVRSPVGLLNRVRANEFWLLSNVFGWRDDDAGDVRCAHARLAAVLSS